MAYVMGAFNFSFNVSPRPKTKREAIKPQQHPLLKLSLAQHKTHKLWPSPKEMKKNPLTQSEDLTIKGFERFRFSLVDGQKHKSTHTKGKKKKEEISCRF